MPAYKLGEKWVFLGRQSAAEEQREREYQVGSHGAQSPVQGWIWDPEVTT